MTKREFLDTLQSTLARELSEAEVADNVNYYENYIEQQVISGKSEAQVLEELGDPRLIAKTILQVDTRREEEAEGGSYRSTVFTEAEDAYGPEEAYGREEYRDPFEENFGGSIHVHRMTWKTWLIVALVIFLFFIIIGTVFSIVWRLLPFLLIGMAVLWIYRYFSGR